MSGSHDNFDRRRALDDLRFFLSMGDKWRGWLWGGAALSALSLLAGIGLLGLAGWFLTASALAGIAAGGIGAITFNFLKPSAGIRASAMTRALARYAERLVTHEATFRILAQIRLWVFARAIPLSPGRLGAERAGSLLARVTSDVDALDNLYLRLVTPALAAGAGLLATLIVIGLISPLAALAGGLLFVLAALITPLWVARQSANLGLAATTSLTEARADALDLADGMAELTAFQAVDTVNTRLKEHTDRQINAEREAAKHGALAGALISAGGGMAAVFVFLLAVLADASAPFAALAAFAIFALFEAAAPLAQAAELFGKTAASARRLRKLDEITPTADDPPLNDASPARKGNHLAFRAVSLRYPNAPASALEEITLDIPFGTKLGIVGASGSGKSSLFQLLLRFYDPSLGVLALDGVDVTTARQAAMRGRIAFQGQRSDLISATVAENVRMADPSANEDQVWSALKAARADDVVRALPQGLDTWIGEDGQLLSGGQARRIALARALLKSAPILALDEPTEGLDRQTEADIIAALAEHLQSTERTVLIATHRPALLALVDRVIKLENGRIVFDGPRKH